MFPANALAQEAVNDWAVFTEFNSQTYSENFTIWGILDGIDDSVFTSGGEASFTHTELAIGARKGRWELSLFTRYDYLANYTADTAFLAFADEAGVEVPDADYDISLNLTLQMDD